MRDFGYDMMSRQALQLGVSLASQSVGFTPAAGIPVNSVAPAVTPTTNIVLNTVLTTTSGTWSGSPSFTYQWLRDGIIIPSATATTYTVAAADNGALISCQVTATNGNGSAIAISNAVGPVISVVPVNTVAPVQSPTTGIIIGTVLSVDTGTWSNSPSSYRYQWRRGAGNIGGATTNSYTVAVADHNQLITCQVWATNVIGESATFATSQGVTPNLAPVNTVLPAVTPTSGLTNDTVLTTTNGTWSNTPSGYTYQWLRSGASISGATAATYTVGSADNGATLSCQVTATNAQGSTMATSNSVGPAVTTLRVYQAGVYTPGVYE